MSITITPVSNYGLALHYLREMLGDSEMWRAIVADPTATYSELITLRDAATSPEAAAKAKITYGYASDKSGDDDYVAVPRIILRHLDGNDSEKTASSGFADNGMLVASIELVTPDVYVGNFPDAYAYAMEQVGGIRDEIAVMARISTTESNYLGITRLSVPTLGQIDPKGNQSNWVFVAEFIVMYRGAYG